MEGFLILLGILWLLGIFRGFVIPITVKHEVHVKNNLQPQPETPNPNSFTTEGSKQKTVSTGKYGLNDAEDIDYEEVK